MGVEMRMGKAKQKYEEVGNENVKEEGVAKEEKPEADAEEVVILRRIDADFEKCKTFLSLL